MSLVSNIKKRCTSEVLERITLREYLERCKKEGKEMYLNAAERMLKAIGEPKIIQTADDERLRSIFNSQPIKRYEAFKDFYGVESSIEQIVNFFKHAALNLEESKQILYLLGPVGSAKSSISDRLKKIFQTVPLWHIEDSPVFDNPLTLLDEEDAKEYKIPKQYVKGIPSPWLKKRVEELDEEMLDELHVVKRLPNILQGVAISKTEPGDENNQDISDLTGKISMRKLGKYDQNDPDCYEFSGGLNKGNRGIMEFVEMFKAPIKTLAPLLEATQSQHYNGTERIGSIPFEGIVLAHSNESEWQKFAGNKDNEAFLDRVVIIKFPYNLRMSEEVKILKKVLEESSIPASKVAPHTLEVLAQTQILTRLVNPDNSDIYAKMKVYNGDDIKDNNKTKSFLEYQQALQEDNNHLVEGMKGLSTREGSKLLSKVVTRTEDYSANPVHMMEEIRKYMESLGDIDLKDNVAKYMADYIQPEYAKLLQEDIIKAYIKEHDEFLQSKFDRYVLFADYWVQDRDYRDPDTGHIFDRDELNDELSVVEKEAKIGNPKEFRHEVVNFVLRNKKEKGLKWDAYKKLGDVIKRQVLNKLDDMVALIDTGGKGAPKTKTKYSSLVKEMEKLGYPKSSIRIVLEWYKTRSRNS